MGARRWRALGLFYDLGHSEGLARAGCAKKHLIALPLFDGLGKLDDGGRLIARRGKLGVHDECLAAFEFVAHGHILHHGQGFVGMGIGHNGTSGCPLM